MKPSVIAMTRLPGAAFLGAGWFALLLLSPEAGALITRYGWMNLDGPRLMIATTSASVASAILFRRFLEEPGDLFRRIVHANGIAATALLLFAFVILAGWWACGITGPATGKPIGSVIQTSITHLLFIPMQFSLLVLRHALLPALLLFGLHLAALITLFSAAARPQSGAVNSGSTV